MIRKAALIIILAILIFSAFTVDVLYARPVSYKGGWVLDAKADIDSYWGLINYTPERWYSVGQRTEVFKDGWVFTGGQLNILAKRWNHQDWQANIFLKTGTGLAATTYKGRNKLDAAVFAGGSADWENRRFFIMYENRFMYAGGIECFFEQKIRPGIAPYIGDYGDIHTWLMVDVKYKICRDKRPEFDVVPLARFFKGPLMAEAGASVKGDVYFSWTMLF